MAVVNGNPAIVYNNVTSGGLKYVRASDATGAAWGTPVNVDTGGAVGANNSLAVLSNGFPAISYYAASPAGNLKFPHATDINGAAWAVATLDSGGDVGQHTPASLRNARPDAAPLCASPPNRRQA